MVFFNNEALYFGLRFLSYLLTCNEPSKIVYLLGVKVRRIGSFRSENYRVPRKGRNDSQNKVG